MATNGDSSVQNLEFPIPLDYSITKRSQLPSKVPLFSSILCCKRAAYKRMFPLISRLLAKISKKLTQMGCLNFAYAGEIRLVRRTMAQAVAPMSFSSSWCASSHRQSVAEAAPPPSRPLPLPLTLIPVESVDPMVLRRRGALQ